MITILLYALLGAVVLLAGGVLIAVLAAFFRRPSPAPPDGTIQRDDAAPEEPSPREREFGDPLSRATFGPALAGKVWDALMARRRKPWEGVIVERHKEFCGQGLVRADGGVTLCDIHDGHTPGPPIAAWTDRAGFVAFFARQSDFSCSGWDPSEPVFFTTNAWYRDNQRLTRAVLERFLREEAARGARVSPHPPAGPRGG